MNREQFYIFQNDAGTIYAHTADWIAAFEYLTEIIKDGFGYDCIENGTATIYTIINPT